MEREVVEKGGNGGAGGAVIAYERKILARGWTRMDTDKKNHIPGGWGASLPAFIGVHLWAKLKEAGTEPREFAGSKYRFNKGMQGGL